MRIVVFLSILFLGACTIDNPNIPEKYKNTKSDTLNVGYMYWWSGGPFTGQCGFEYSIALTGIITKIYKPKEAYMFDGDTLYIPQKGVIEINDIYMAVNTEKEKYIGQKYISSDCFWGEKLEESDKVIVFMYAYEGLNCIPSNSIIKIEDYRDPIVFSTIKYIKNGYDPLSIIQDTTIWSKYKLDDDLKRIIDCKIKGITSNNID